MFHQLSAWKTTETKSLLSAIFDFPFFLHSAQIHSLILNLLKMKLTNKNASNVITKLKAVSVSLCCAACAGHITYHFVLLLWKLGCCILKRLERESRFLFSKKYKGGRGERGQFIGENSVCIIVTNTKRSMKKCYWFPRPVLLCLLLVLYYTIIQIFTIVSASVNK